YTTLFRSALARFDVLAIDDADRLAIDLDLEVLPEILGTVHGTCLTDARCRAIGSENSLHPWSHQPQHRGTSSEVGGGIHGSEQHVFVIDDLPKDDRTLCRQHELRHSAKLLEHIAFAQRADQVGQLDGDEVDRVAVTGPIEFGDGHRVGVEQYASLHAFDVCGDLLQDLLEHAC